MLDMDITPCKSDPYVWIQKAMYNTKYEYAAIYVEDLFIACNSPAEIIQTLKNKFNLKINGDGELRDLLTSKKQTPPSFPPPQHHDDNPFD